MADVVGSAEFELRATRQKMKDDLRQAEADLKQFGDKAERDIGGNAGRIGGSISRMAATASAAVMALVSVVGLAVAGAFALGRAGQQMAADIAATASRIGVSTDALQEWRHVATQAGQDAATADRALERFAERFALATSGVSREDLRIFQSLGFSEEQLRSFGSVEAALDAVVDRIGELSSEADRAAVAEKLGLGDLAAQLREGGGEIARLRNEARALGLVMDRDMIDRAARAQTEFDTLARIIDINLKSAFLDLAPAINTVTRALADALDGLGQFINRFRSVQDMGARSLREEDARLAAQQMRYVERHGPPDRSRMNPITRGEWDRINARRAAIATRLAELSPVDTPDGAGGGRQLVIPPSGGVSRVDRSAEREARRAERVEQEIYRARQRYLQIAEGDLLTAQERFDLLRDQLRLDREARDAELASKRARGEITAAELEQLAQQHALNDALEDRVITDRAFREIEDERLATERLMAELAADLLSLQSGAARTARERRQIELDLLAIAQRERREALRREMDRNPSLTPDQRRAMIAQADAVDEAERRAVERHTMSPMERWRDESLKTTEEVAEALEGVAARGLNALNEGIVDAITGARDLGEAFRQVAQGIIADLAAIAVRQYVTEPLANLLFGSGGPSSGGSGGGGWLSGIMSSFAGLFGGGRAAGGPVSAGMIYRVGEHGPETLIMPRDGMVIPNQGFAAGSGQSGGGPREIIVRVQSDDPKFRAFIQETTAPAIAASHQSAVSTATGQMASGMAESQRRAWR